MRKQTYLGDGLYAEYNGKRICITTLYGQHTLNEVCLYPGALKAFIGFLEKEFDLKITKNTTVRASLEEQR